VIPTALLNTLVLITVWRRPSLHSPSNVFICNLALSDIAVAVIGIPTFSAWKLSELKSMNHATVCSLAYTATVMGTTVGGASFLTITAATVDRYLALKLHLSYVSVVTTYRVMAVCISTWFISGFLSIFLFLAISEYYILILSIMIPSIILIGFCYCKIFAVVQHHHNQIHIQTGALEGQGTFPNIHRFKKTLSALFYLFVLFIILYTPYVAVMLLHEINGVSMLYLNGWIVSTSLMYTNSVLNPLIYCWRLRELRTAMKETCLFFFCNGGNCSSAV